MSDKMELYDQLVDELDGDEEIAVHLILDHIDEKVLRELIADVKERVSG